MIVKLFSNFVLDWRIRKERGKNGLKNYGIICN